MKFSGANTTIKPRLMVEAVVIRACKNCGKPGIDADNKYHESCWYCGAERPENENLGKIYDSNQFWQLKEKIKRWITG
jgi:hypothetical protein